MILEDFDNCKTSTFDPFEVQNVVANFPKIGITCFSYKLFNRLLEAFKGEKIAAIKNSNGEFPVYKINYNGVEYAFFMSIVGASACAVQYEELFAMGLETVITFGSCGVLDKNIDDIAIIIPSFAIRDEGTSYHYLPSCDEIEVNLKYKEDFISVLNKHNVNYVEGKVWTIDAPYRETKDKVLKRKEMGCVCVDMESSALAAVAKFRNKEVFQFFYAADNLDASKWDKRSLGGDSLIDEKLAIGYLAIETAEKIYMKKHY